MFNSDYFLFDIVKNSHTEKLENLPIEEIPLKLLETMVSLIPDKIETANDMLKRTQASKDL